MPFYLENDSKCFNEKNQIYIVFGDKETIQQDLEIGKNYLGDA